MEWCAGSRQVPSQLRDARWQPEVSLAPAGGTTALEVWRLAEERFPNASAPFARATELPAACSASRGSIRQWRKLADCDELTTCLIPPGLAGRLNQGGAGGQ